MNQSSPTPPTAGLAAAAAALVSLAEMYASLPMPSYVGIHTFTSAMITLQLDTTDEFEQWRAALTVPAEAIELKTFNGVTWLAANALFQGVEIRLRGYGVELAPELSAVAA